jgi:uncharacterized protein
MVIAANSLGFSALSLRDNRLELAIGAHSMLNVFATLQSLFFTATLRPMHIPATMSDCCAMVILKGVLPFALMYGFLQKTGGWLAPTGTHLASPNDIRPNH